MITPWFTRIKKMLISCINDEKIVPPPLYVHPKENPKTTIEKGMKYLDDILSTSLTLSTIPITSTSDIFMKFNTFLSFGSCNTSTIGVIYANG